MISFLLNDKEINISSGDNNQTVLEWLRDSQKLTGTKEGCGSGDCGACTVVIAEVNKTADGLEYRPINSCITFMSALAGKQLITVEHLRDKDLHPVQQAMVDSHGSQCGFCTPGFVMSMFAMYQNQINEPQTLDRHSINKHLSGNLCRCTGYRPIVDACKTACEKPTADKFSSRTKETIQQLTALSHPKGIHGLHIPLSRKELKDCLATCPDAVLLAGSTDLGLEVTQKHVHFEHLVALSHVPELIQIKEEADKLIVGAAVTYQQLEPLLLKHFPEAEEWLDRLGSLPIRQQGTMGGNVANASPIGDCPPLLLALDAVCVIDDGDRQQDIPIGEFFTGYRQTKLAPGQWLSHLYIPYKAPDALLRVYKVSKRIEDDISAVCAAFYLELKNNKVSRFRSGFGGVAATPVGAHELQMQLLGMTWDNKTIELGASILAKSFSPISDVRGSAEYRNQIIQNLWRRFAIETTNQRQPIKVRVEHA
ncbi:MAG: xanthine dehydrogenase small subunit [Aestuariibacter sp.]